MDLSTNDTSPDNSSNLPDSILLDILIKLPLKSVIACKFVCKSWYNLVSNSMFAEAYNSEKPFKCSLHYESESLHLDETVKRKALQTPFNLKLPPTTDDNDTLRIVGSCDGLCCFLLQTILRVQVFKETVYIYNPLTCEYIELPEVRCEETDHVRSMSFGFGRSTHANQYKVVRFLPRVHALILESRIQGQVFTVGVDDMWRDFEDPYIPYTSGECSVLFNGVVHWMGFEASSYSRFIYAFNVEEEKGERIQLPLALRDAKREAYIGILNDRLCAMRVEDYFHVWIMKDYGVVESWTRYTFARGPIRWEGDSWGPGFVCNLASRRFALDLDEVEDVDSPIYNCNGEEAEHEIVGGHEGCQALPYVPCFSSLDDVFAGGNLRVRRIRKRAIL